MKRWLIPLLGLAVALAATTAVTVALTGSLTGSGDQPPIRSDEGIDPNECSLVHNINACDRLIEKAKEELAARLATDSDSIAVVSRELVQWPDASLSNPQPGMVYAQVITPGFRLILEAAGQTYEYHTDLKDRVEFVR